MRNDESTTKVYIWAVRTIPTANMIRKTLTKEYSLLTTKAASQSSCDEGSQSSCDEGSHYSLDERLLRFEMNFKDDYSAR